jgi:DNA-binding response OmpR family regulator
VRVIVLSGNVDSSRPAAEIGADALMTKPSDLRRLVAEVNALLERG